MPDFKESDLSYPIKEYFESCGYEVNCEVKNCDLTARKAERLVVVEIKKNFNAKLLFQAIDRQRFADEVYIAVPKPKRLTKDTPKMRHIAQELNLGLIYVSINGPVEYIDILCMPKAKDEPRNTARKRFVMEELSGRTMDINKAGTNKEKLATAYREKCIQIAAIMYYEKIVTPKLLRDKYGLEASSASMLGRNHYGWFDRIEKGKYTLSNAVEHEIEKGKFASVFKLYIEKYKDIYKGANGDENKGGGDL